MTAWKAAPLDLAQEKSGESLYSRGPRGTGLNSFLSRRSLESHLARPVPSSFPHPSPCSLGGLLSKSLAQDDPQPRLGSGPRQLDHRCVVFMIILSVKTALYPQISWALGYLGLVSAWRPMGGPMEVRVTYSWNKGPKVSHFKQDTFIIFSFWRS